MGRQGESAVVVESVAIGIDQVAQDSFEAQRALRQDLDDLDRERAVR
jgi:hypothetical protein